MAQGDTIGNKGEGVLTAEIMSEPDEIMSEPEALAPGAVVEVSVNNFVRFIPTPEGRAILQEDADAARVAISERAGSAFAATLDLDPKYEDDGSTTMQMWDFASKLGPRMGHAQPSLIVDNSIEILTDGPDTVTAVTVSTPLAEERPMFGPEEPEVESREPVAQAD
jgi:hypothetical protein